jgi:hypothetical protein
MLAPYAGFEVVGLLLLLTLAAVRRDPALLHVVLLRSISRTGQGSPVLGDGPSVACVRSERWGMHVPCGRALPGRRCTGEDLYG